MSMPVPSYTFITSGGQRRFVHRWHLNNNEVIECNKCGLTTCKATDAYSLHWPKPKTMPCEECSKTMGNSNSNSGLMDLQHVMMANKNIESFMLCDTKAISNTHQFLLDAGIKAIPDLLCLLYGQAQHEDVCLCLGLTVRFYVQIKKELYSLQTTELLIKHHYDIRESVDMIFAMLLEKLTTFMAVQCEFQDYGIKRLYIRIRKHHCQQRGHLTLPMQFMRKQHDLEQQTVGGSLNNCSGGLTKPTEISYDLSNLTACFETHLHCLNETFQPPFPCNLYNFQVCPNSLELYAVPYHLSECVATTPNFIILNDIDGHFTELQEIKNIKRFLHHSMEDRVYSCPYCRENFNEANKLSIHKLLNCGHGFEFKKIDPDLIEIYENCLLLQKCNEYTLYGIIE